MKNKENCMLFFKLYSLHMAIKMSYLYDYIQLLLFQIPTQYEHRSNKESKNLTLITNKV